MAETVVAMPTLTTVTSVPTIVVTSVPTKDKMNLQEELDEEEEEEEDDIYDEDEDDEDDEDLEELEALGLGFQASHEDLLKEEAEDESISLEHSDHPVARLLRLSRASLRFLNERKNFQSNRLSAEGVTASEGSLRPPMNLATQPTTDSNLVSRPAEPQSRKVVSSKSSNAVVESGGSSKHRKKDKAKSKRTAAVLTSKERSLELLLKQQPQQQQQPQINSETPRRSKERSKEKGKEREKERSKAKGKGRKKRKDKKSTKTSNQDTKDKEIIKATTNDEKLIEAKAVEERVEEKAREEKSKNAVEGEKRVVEEKGEAEVEKRPLEGIIEVKGAEEPEVKSKETAEKAGVEGAKQVGGVEVTDGLEKVEVKEKEKIEEIIEAQVVAEKAEDKKVEDEQGLVTETRLVVGGEAVQEAKIEVGETLVVEKQLSDEKLVEKKPVNGKISNEEKIDRAIEKIVTEEQSIEGKADSEIAIKEQIIEKETEVEAIVEEKSIEDQEKTAKEAIEQKSTAVVDEDKDRLLESSNPEHSSSSDQLHPTTANNTSTAGSKINGKEEDSDNETSIKDARLSDCTHNTKDSPLKQELRNESTDEDEAAEHEAKQEITSQKKAEQRQQEHQIEVQLHPVAESSSSRANQIGGRDEYGFAIKRDEFEAWTKERENPAKKAMREKREAFWAKFTKKLKINKTLKSPIRGGIPSEYRSLMWQYCSGSIHLLKRNPGCYADLLAKTVDQTSSATVQINLDLRRTFPENDKYMTEEGIERLRRVLVAYSWYNPEVGYCQSMNFVCGMLLLFMDEEEAFWMMVVIVEKYMAGYYTNTMESSHVDQRVLRQLVARKLPTLSNYMQKCGVELSWITRQWFLCIFIDVLPVESTLRVWDAFFLEGTKVLFRIALALLKLKQDKILATPDDGISLLKEIKEAGLSMHDADSLLRVAFHRIGSLPRSTIAKLRSAHRVHVQKARERADSGRV